MIKLTCIFLYVSLWIKRSSVIFYSATGLKERRSAWSPFEFFTAELEVVKLSRQPVRG